jgi:hypothetical protein
MSDYCWKGRPVLFGVQVPPMIDLIATLTDRSLLPRQQPGRPQPTGRPRHADRRRESW